MAICGKEFSDGIVCGQYLGHELRQGIDYVPHMRWSDGGEYHAMKHGYVTRFENGELSRRDLLRCIDVLNRAEENKYDFKED